MQICFLNRSYNDFDTYAPLIESFARTHDVTVFKIKSDGAWPPAHEAEPHLRKAGVLFKRAGRFTNLNNYLVIADEIVCKKGRTSINLTGHRNVHVILAGYNTHFEQYGTDIFDASFVRSFFVPDEHNKRLYEN